MSVLAEVAELCAQLGLGTWAPTTTGGTIHLSKMPAELDDGIAVQRYGLGESDSTLDYDEIGVQVRVRGPRGDTRVGEAKADAVYAALHGLGSRTLAGGTWLQLMVGTQGGPIYIGDDPQDRPEWTVNFRAEISRSTTGLRR